MNHEVKSKIPHVRNMISQRNHLRYKNAWTKIGLPTWYQSIGIWDLELSLPENV